MSLRAKFLALFAVFAVIPLISIGVFDYIYSLRALEALIATEVGEIATRAATIFAQTLPDYGTDVWLFSTREGEPPVAITRDENSEFWYYQPSPDGRYIAYTGEIQRGSSLWLVDLGDALASGGN